MITNCNCSPPVKSLADLLGASRVIGREGLTSPVYIITVIPCSSNSLISSTVPSSLPSSPVVLKASPTSAENSV